MRLFSVLLTGCGTGGAIFADGGGTRPIGDTDTDADTDADTDTDTDADPSTWEGSLTVCINEIMPDNQASFADETGAFPDWIEIHNPTGAEVSLRDWTITDDQGDPGKHRLGSVTVPAYGFLLLFADGFPLLGPQHLSFSLDAEGEEVGLYTPDGEGTVVVFGAIAGDLSAARVPDCCVGEGCWQYPFGGTPVASNVPREATTPLLPAGSTWRFFDGGNLPGAAWFGAGFDDGSWASGPAPLGYGDAPATAIGWGSDPAQRFETAWFRTTVQVADPAGLNTVRLRILRDDGVGVFVNGISTYRNNLPAESGADVLAVSPIEPPDEGSWLEATIPRELLLVGSNTIAVEVHQASVNSDDLMFDLEILTDP